MSITKIDWCDYTVNYVWGCLNNCPYCYARGIARRFAIPVGKAETLSRLTRAYYRDEDIDDETIVEEGIIGRLFHFEPTLLESAFAKPLPKKPSVIFLNSMSDVFYWDTEWMKRTLEKVKQNPQQMFIMLTKFDVSVGMMMYDPHSPYQKPDNLKMGLTIDGTNENWMENDLGSFDFVNFEPLQARIGKLGLEWIMDGNGIEWIIIGAETGNRKGKVVPKREWVEEIADAAKEAGVPVWMKDNLAGVMGVAGNLMREHPYRK